MRAFCPACAVEVEYEGQGYNAACSICGRTQAAAEQTAVGRKERARDAKLKWLWIGLGVLGVVLLFAFSTERALGTLISATVQVVGLAVVIWIFSRVKNWLGRR